MALTIKSAADVKEKELCAQDLITYANELGRGDLVNGRFIKEPPPNYRHGLVEANLGRILGNHIHEQKIGYVLVGEAGVFTKTAPDTVRGADVIVLTHDQLRDAQDTTYLTKGPLLIVEVISKNDKPREVQEKVEEYFAIGTAMVWIVNWEVKSVAVYKSPSNSSIYRETDVLRDLALAEFKGLEIRLENIFDGI